MMKTATKTTLAIALSLPLLAGCVTPGEDDANAATKQGAVGGALLGLTLGALTGDAELAMKGAVAGGVAGGVAGAGEDVRNNRNNIRQDSRDDAISSIANQQGAQQKKQSWDELNNFVGHWTVTIQNHDQTLEGVHPIKALGSLATTSQADIQLSNDQGVDLTAQFSFDKEQGYQLNVANNAKEVSVNFAGEFVPNMNRYHFYPTDANAVVYQGVPSGSIRAELGFAGTNVWMLDTYAYIDGSEQKVQTFRFNKVK